MSSELNAMKLWPNNWDAVGVRRRQSWSDRQKKRAQMTEIVDVRLVFMIFVQVAM